MEFFALLLPGSLLFVAFAVPSMRIDGQLFRLAQARYPAAVDAARGRERRWSDIWEALRINEKPFRSRFFAALAEPARSDPQLAELMERARRADRRVRDAGLAGIAVTVVLWLAVLYWANG